MAVGSRRTHYRVTFAVLSLGVAAFALLQSLVIPVLTTVQHQLHTTQDTVTPGRISWLPAVLLSAWLVALLVALSEAPTWAGRLTRQFGGKALVIAGCLCGSVAMTILAFAHQQQWEIYLSGAIMGVGFGLAFSAMSALVVAAVPSSQTGVASGMNANIRTIGGSIGSAVMASIVTSRLEPSGLPKESGYTIGFAVMAAGLVLAALAGLLIPSARGLRRKTGELEHAEMAIVAGGTIVGDQSE